jgi:hypothetical protein
MPIYPCPGWQSHVGSPTDRYVCTCVSGRWVCNDCDPVASFCTDASFALDVGVDSPVDASTDASTEMPADAPVDAPIDAPLDAPTDVLPDVPADAAPPPDDSAAPG